MLQELLERAEAAQIFEQIPLVAVGKMRGVEWAVITVRLFSFYCSYTARLVLLPTECDYHPIECVPECFQSVCICLPLLLHQDV